MDETFDAERATRLFYYALRNRNADVVGLALKAARAAGEPAGKLIAAAAAGEGVEWWNVSALLVRAAEYGEEPPPAYFADDKKLRKAAGDASSAIRKKKAAGNFRSLGLDPLTRGEVVLARLVLGEGLGEAEVAEATVWLGHPYEDIRRMALRAVSARPASGDLIFTVIERQRQLPFAEVCELLGELRDPRGVPHLARLLTREEARPDGGVWGRRNTLREETAGALVKIADEQAVGLLASRVVDWGEIARGALKSIGRAAAPTLLRLFAEDPRWRREEAVLLAEVAGPDSLDALLGALRDRYRAARENAETGLTTLGAAAVGPLLRLLESDEQETRLRAARVLGNVGDAAALGPLARMARGADARERRAAIEALGGFPDENSLALLAESLRAPERETRRAAAAALGRRRDGARAAALLAEASADGDRVVRLEAVEVLPRLAADEAARPAVAEALTRFLKDEEVEVVEKASDSLGGFGEVAVTLVEAAMRNAAGEHSERLKDILDRIKSAEKNRFIPGAGSASAVMATATDLRGLFDDADEGWLGDPAAEGREAAVTTSAPPISDNVHFTVTAPRVAAPGASFVLDVWAHTERQRRAVLARARKASRRREIGARSRGPVPVERGAEVAVRLTIPALGFDEEDRVYWVGEVGNCNFAVRVAPDAPPGIVAGTAYLSLGGTSLTRLHFELEVGADAGEADDLVTREERIKSAFASYASEERELVLAGVQGLSKARPDLDIFLDVVALRSGERWAERLAEEVPKRDVLYLFWSRAAGHSEWVEKEWRAAYAAKGVGGIDPFPLEPQGVAPAPPDELKSLHFDDPLLGFARRGK